jgi:hypothetical protein
MAFFPDPSPVPERKRFFKLIHLVRLYVGPELKVQVQGWPLGGGSRAPAAG